MGSERKRNSSRGTESLNEDLAAAFLGEPWSLSGVVFGMGSLRDDEGRPLGERRAPASVKEGVAMALRPCPYGDERQRRSMNVSALEQITRHLDAVLDDVARFRAMSSSRSCTWEEVYVVTIDQLAQPAVHLLRRRQPEAPVPARMSVGYKIAAGFSTPLRELLELEATGASQAVTVENLLGLVKRRKFLVGAGEVCAAPPAMIARVTEVLIRGGAGAHADLDPERLAIARSLALQVRVGIAWRLFDLAAERALLIDDIGVARLRPRTEYLARMLDERVAELERRPQGDDLRLPDGLSPETSEQLREAVRTGANVESRRATTSRRIEESLAYGDAAIGLDASAWGLFSRSFAAYLDAYRTFSRVLKDLELSHRRQLGYARHVPVKLSDAIFPVPKALRWFERIMGYRLRSSEPAPDGLVLKNGEGATLAI